MESISEETQVLAKKMAKWDSLEDNFVATGGNYDNNHSFRIS